MIRVAVFASGTGTNALRLLEASRQLNRTQVVCVIIDRASSPLLKTIPELYPNTPVTLIEKNAEKTKTQHETEILKVLNQFSVDWCFLAGYMRILGTTLLSAFARANRPARIINIHPSLLPLFPGANAYEDAFNEKVPESGITIHFVDDQVDTGPIIIQKKFPRYPTDQLEDFKKRGQEIEWSLYPEILRKLDEAGTL